MADDNHSEDVLDFGDDIDSVIFGQILEMDDDEDDRDFSRQIVSDFFGQADTTLASMDEALEKGDLDELHKLGHFLKGSAATLGLVKVKHSCEKIQNWGGKKDEHGDTELDEKSCLSNIKSIMPTVKTQCKVAKALLRSFYGGFSKTDA